MEVSFACLLYPSFYLFILSMQHLLIVDINFIHYIYSLLLFSIHKLYNFYFISFCFFNDFGLDSIQILVKSHQYSYYVKNKYIIK